MARFARRCSTATIAEAAAAAILQRGTAAGAHALMLRDIALDGAAMKAFTAVLRRDGITPRVLKSHVRAALDATRDADELLREALGAKKLKELRRQRNRLADHGDVSFRHRAHAGRCCGCDRNLPEAGSQRLERQARHRFGAG